MSSTENGPRSIAADRTQLPSSSCVTDDWEISLVLCTRWVLPLRAQFTYRADDPYAAQLDIHLDTRQSVRWTFARELLATGTVRPAGFADVRAWPADDGTRVSLCLESHQGEALFEIPLAPLSEWLERTYQLVPQGQEHSRLSLDSWLEGLLQEAPYSSGSTAADLADRACGQADDTTGTRACTDRDPGGEHGGASGA
ncbi:SsgA family sporulation/cell division regulator [Streptomyces ovatisporus]|uniref:SsgA family sporulation/cell division regulator n=1 Tax=Streptomyces ovatisporus TaxID=1128682 RepID=A0ABV9A1U2_9ACTN